LIVRKPKLNPEREQRILMDIIVDAYDETERAMGWYCYLEEQLGTEFEARVRSEYPTSPLKLGETVSVLAMAPDDICQSDMFVWIRWSDRKLAVPLSQLTPLVDDKSLASAVADWHYWVERGYRF
jgi:hypothetical protein